MSNKPALAGPKGVAPPENPDLRGGSGAPRAAVHSPEEPYLLLPNGFSVQCVPRSGAISTVKRFVAEGCLTPVLGSEITDALTVPGQTIVRDPLLERHFGARPELRRYHEALFDQRSLGRAVAEDPRPDSERLEAVDNAVTELRLALLDAAHQATVLYAALWSRSVAPLSDRNLHEVAAPAPAVGADDPVAPLLRLLEEAEIALERLQSVQTAEQEDVDHRLALLGATGLQSRLSHLRHMMGRERTLRGATVEWLTDVLWHALSFDSPCYPSREELALQVSLAVDSPTPVEKVELTALTPAGIDQDWDAYGHSLSRTLAGLRGSQRAVPPVGKLHRALSASLYGSFLKWREAAAKSAEERVPAPVSLAITLTTDLELERALATDPGGSGHYHVAFPMIITNANHNNRGHLRWVVGRFVGGLDQQAPGFWEQLTRPDGPWQLLNDVAEEFVLSGFDAKLPGGLEGPLLLKANGSPLHEVDSDLSKNSALRDGFVKEIPSAGAQRLTGRRGGKARHVPATTELDILQLTQVDQWAMGSSNGRAGLPTMIRKVLEDPTRRWLIVGHDLPEWSSRLQLFTQISLSSIIQRSLATASVREATLAVMRQADEQRTRLLAGMDIPLTDYDQLDPDGVAAAITAGLSPKKVAR